MSTDKMLNGTKRRRDIISKVIKAEWDIMLNRNNIEWNKMSNRNNVEWDKTLNDKMSNGTKCRIVYNVEYRLCVIVSMFVTVVCCC